MTKTFAQTCRERAEKATAGPWQTDGTGTVIADLGSITEHGSTWTVVASEAGPFSHSLEDAYFIAHAREDVPELCSRLEEACQFIRNCGADHIADELEAMPGEK